MDCSMPGFPVLCNFPELTKTHVHWVGDAIQPSHPLIPFSYPQSFPASGSFQMSWLFTSGGQNIAASATVSVFQWIFKDLVSPLRLTGLISLQFKRLSRVFSSTTVWKHQFFATQPSLWSNSCIQYRTTGKTIALNIQTFVSKVISVFLNTI